MMRMKSMIRVGLLFTIALSNRIAQGFELPWFTVDGGGAYSAGGNFELEGTIGQPDAGLMSGGTFTLTGGFWPGALQGDLPYPGDCDGDGDVDLADYIASADCLTGPNGGLVAGCDCFDFDGDGDADLRDFAEFQFEFTGR